MLRASREGGSYFRLKSDFLEATKKEGLTYKEARPHQIKAIKEKLRGQKIAEKRQFYKAMIISAFVSIILFFGIGWAIRTLFF